MQRVRERLTFANVISTISLLFALGLGSAWASTELARNSVGAPQIEKNAVRAAEIGKNAVRKAETAKNSVGTSEVTDGSLLTQDFAPGQLPAGPQGEQGRQGEQGQQGEQGPPGVSGYEIVTFSHIFEDNQASFVSQDSCPGGKKILGGGVSTFNDEIYIASSTPLSQSGVTNEWFVSANTFDNQPIGVDSSVIVRLVCANVE